MHAPIALLIAPLALVGCVQEQPRSVTQSRVPAAEVLGVGQSCVPITSLGDSRIRDNRTIDFIRGGNKGWRVTLPLDCPGLASANAFSYETSLSQLCSTDIIHVLDNAGGLHRGASCGLGEFVPIRLSR